MAYTVPKEAYNGKINQVEVGRNQHKLIMGGEETLPFLSFEGKAVSTVPLALEIQDINPTGDWASSLTEIYGSVMDNPAEWARMCQDEFKADMICLRLAGTHPDNGDRSPQEAGKIVEAVLSAIKVPLIILGSNHVEKDAAVIKHVAEVAANTGSIIGKAQEKNYKTFAAVATAYGHKLVALSDLDINLSKQLNILLTQSGFDSKNIIIDAMSSTLGYGLEYTYSVMERIRLSALQQNDAMMQMPMICDIGEVTWKVKEAKATEQDQPAWGAVRPRGILWEVLTALSFLMAGGNLVVFRHPEALSRVRSILAELMATA
ncbi:MAG: acetyl-CoA decarbonylase/synthase complex subunit delta [bacterium]|nr:acetyl-CoA decarbonylase/synthase complex subunit delta [bacterium]